MDTLTGCVERLTYHDEENAFTVASILPQGQKKPVVIVGTLASIQVGETVVCQGVWKCHPRHGKQFEVSSYSLELPNDASDPILLILGHDRSISGAFSLPKTNSSS